MHTLDSAFVKDAARRAGFHACGVARAGPLDPGPLDRVLSVGAEADMAWLGARRAERLDPRRVLPGALSVVVVALGYAPRSWPAEPVGGEAEVARFARGRDYHAVMKRRLRALRAEIAARDPDAHTFASSDAAPVMEKAWAERAGVGWVGKNGCLVTLEHGSWVVLGTVLVDRDLEPDVPHPSRCGTCEACLGGCPTGAILEPGLVDSRRCLSFWTIERRGEVPDDVAGALGSRVFGCDACQTSCPWNRKARPACDPDLEARPGNAALALSDLLALDEESYRRRFNGTSIARARYDGLVRNALLVAGCARDRSQAEAVRAHLSSPHPGVRAAAEWAMARLRRGDGQG